MKNDYLEQVLQEQKVVEAELNAPRMRKKAKPQSRGGAPIPQAMAAMAANIAPPPELPSRSDGSAGNATSGADGDHAVEARVTGLPVATRAALMLVAAALGAALVAGGATLAGSVFDQNLCLAIAALFAMVAGLWPHYNVVVPPNVYVVHTRRGQEEPVHMGLGLSFRYNPTTDAFLLIPGALQTLLINARSICVERQGIMLQAYVQWIVKDIGKAYRKLDFSNPDDPMSVVNVQLREQAEAAIKDKVSTMRIDEVLADKAVIIEELTARLREVAEGKGETGLGLEIVTVQIKEAVVSSSRVWQNLQRPYRSEQEKLARLAEIENERAVRVREQAESKTAELERLAAEDEVASLQHQQQAERFDREHKEAERRLELEQQKQQRAHVEEARTETVRREQEQQLKLSAVELAIARKAAEIRELEAKRSLMNAHAEVEREKQKHSLEMTLASARSAHEARKLELEVRERQQSIDNSITPQRVEADLYALLPEVASKLPQPKELRTLQITGEGGASGALATLLSLAEGLRSFATRAEPEGGGSA